MTDVPPPITRLDRPAAEAELPALADLLADAVAGGASVGFVLPFTHDEALRWWAGQLPAVEDGTIVLFAARDGDRLAGTVQLQLPWKPNARHRAEVAKLLVHSSARRRGLGRALLAAAEDAARADGRTTLHLDTETGSAAERLYREAGWTVMGVMPDHAARPDGRLAPTTYLYKLLSSSPAGATGG